MALYLMYQAQAADSSEQLAVPELSDLQLDPDATDDAQEPVESEAVAPESTQPAEPSTKDSTN